MRSPRPFQHRLVGRLLLFGGIPTILVLLVSLILGFARTREALRQSVSNEVEDAARLAALDLSDENIQAVTAARTLAAASADGLYGRRAESLSLLRSLLRSTPAFFGTYYVWEPRDDDAGALSLGLEDGAHDAEGRFLPYWRRSAVDKGGLELVPNVDMEAEGSLFYREPRRVHAETGLPTTIVTKPYTYEGVPLIEHTHPIVIDGRFMGIAGVDRSLDRVLADLIALRDDLGDRSDLFLVTRGLYIAATEDDRAADTGLSRLTESPVAGSRYAELLRSFDARDRSSFVVIENDPVLGEPCFYGVARVQPGDWLLVVRQPVASAEAVANRLVVSNAVGTFAAFAAAGLILFLLGRPLVRRVEQSADAVDRIGDGDLTLRIGGDDARDETGDLLRGVAGMSTRLRGMACGVESARRDIASVTDEIVASSETESSNATDFGASATEIAAAVREIAATARELDTDVRRVDGRAAETRETMRGGRRRLEEMSEGMQSIQEATRSIAARLGEISRSATSIGGVVDTIGRIAEQTNLLSVNAAIEAEKAGEYGTGFLVVAREIRRLADQTAGATGEITDTVEGMQSAVSSGVMEMDRYTDRVRRAVDQTDEVSRGLGMALDAAGENAEAIGRVAEGVAAQAAGAGQIDSAMVGLSRGAEQATQTAERLRAAARRLERATNSLNDALDGWRTEGLDGRD